MPPRNSKMYAGIIDEVDFDDEIILVSTIKARWEKLHGIDFQGEEKDHHDHTVENKVDGFHDDDTYEDDIMTVEIKPIPTLNSKESMYQRTFKSLLGIVGDFSSQKLLSSPFCASFIFIAITLSIWGRARLVRKGKPAIPGPTPKENIDVDDATDASTRITRKSDDYSSDRTEKMNERENLTDILGSASELNECRVTNLMEKLESSQNRNGLPGRNEIASSGISHPSSMIHTSSLSLKKQEHDGNIEQQRQHEKLEMARRFVKDIRMVEDVLVENSLDPSIAPQLAIGLQSSQHIIESQCKIAYENAMLDAHQRHLDRQLSEQQHRESLRSSRYDPTWEEKLRKVRDQCYYWNTSNGGVSRLWWEILLAQQLARGVVPVWQRYFSGRAHYSGNFGITMVDHNHGVGSLIGSFLKDSMTSILAQLCDCDSSSTAERLIYTITEETESKTLWVDASYPLSFNIDFGGLVSRFLFTCTSVLKQVLPIPIEYWSCYGYCIMRVSLILFFTMISHQGLRVLSLPLLLHHAVNLMSITLFYGPQRMLSFIFAMLLRTIMVVPAGDDRDATFNGHGDMHEQEWQQEKRMNHIGCSFLLLSLWVFMPLVSWKRTSTLYHQAMLRVRQADPVNFDTSFQNATLQLQLWYRKQMAIRYTILSMYYAVVWWECSYLK